MAGVPLGAQAVPGAASVGPGAPGVPSGHSRSPSARAPVQAGEAAGVSRPRVPPRGRGRGPAQVPTPEPTRVPTPARARGPTQVPTPEPVRVPTPARARGPTQVPTPEPARPWLWHLGRACRAWALRAVRPGSVRRAQHGDEPCRSTPPAAMTNDSSHRYPALGTGPEFLCSSYRALLRARATACSSARSALSLSPMSSFPRPTATTPSVVPLPLAETPDRSVGGVTPARSTTSTRHTATPLVRARSYSRSPTRRLPTRSAAARRSGLAAHSRHRFVWDHCASPADSPSTTIDAS